MSTTTQSPSPRGPAEFERVIAEADETVATFDSAPRGLVKQIQHLLHNFPTAVPFIVLLLSVLVFSYVAGAKFFAPFNLSLVLQQVTIIGVVGIAQTLIILTAGIDLSVGAIMVLSTVVMGRIAVVSGLSAWLSATWLFGLLPGIGIDPMAAGFVAATIIGFGAGVLVGIACGFINGLLVTGLKLPPFIVTLGSWSVFGALVLFISKSATIRQQDIEAAAPFLQFMGTRIQIVTPWGNAPLTYGSIMMILLAVIIWYLLARTAFGRHVYATGDDPEAARLAGISTNKTLLAVYILAGFICSVAGWVLIGRIGAVSPLAGGTANLDSITAVVIGGTSLFGGRGSIVGTLIGALIVGVFRNGLALAGLDNLWQEFAVGVLIIVAVALDQWIRRVAA